MDELAALSGERLTELNKSLNYYNHFPERDGVVLPEDLKQEQRETVSPLLRHYFNGCYSQLDFFVPQLGHVAGTVLGVPALAVAAFLLLRRRKRRKSAGG